MFRRTSHVFPILLAVVLTNCGGIPVLDTPSELTVAHIVDQIQCEVSQVRKYFRDREQWWAVADLTLQVDDSADLAPKVSFIRPLAVEATNFTFGAGAELKSTRQRIYSETIELQVTKAKASKCDTLKDSFDLTGDLGIMEAVRIGTQSYDKTDGGVGFPVSDDKKTAFGQTIQFVITKNVSGVGPAWTLVHFVGPGGFFGAERVDTHKLIISFAKVPAKEATKKGIAAAASAGGGVAATDRATNLNYKMLLQSLPSFRSIR
jgi:hypothetical protein